MALALKFFHDTVGFIGHLLVNVTTLFIIGINMLGCRNSIVVILLYKKVNRKLTVLHTS